MNIYTIIDKAENIVYSTVLTTTVVSIVLYSFIPAIKPVLDYSIFACLGLFAYCIFSLVAFKGRRS